MIVTEQKQFDEIKQNLKSGERLFLIGCGECSTTCKTGGEEEVKALIQKLKEHSFLVTGYTVPKAPCVASGLRMELAKHRKGIEEADSVLVLACGLGVQSVVENLRELKPVHVGCNTLFMGAVDQKGTNFFQYCSACGDCLLEYTAGICPITRCSKGILNGPCGGVDGGKCEVDKERDCAWVLIYERLKKLGRLDLLERIYPPKDYSKVTKPLSRSIS